MHPLFPQVLLLLMVNNSGFPSVFAKAMTTPPSAQNTENATVTDAATTIQPENTLSESDNKLCLNAVINDNEDDFMVRNGVSDALNDEVERTTTNSSPSETKTPRLGFEQLHLEHVIPSHYDRMKWPAPNHGTEPVRVSVLAALGRIQAVNEVDKSLTFDLYLELAWREPRLNLSAKDWSKTDVVPLPPEFSNLLWTPDPYILNLKRLSSASVVKPPRGLEITGDYFVKMSSLAAYEIGCSMNFRDYPVDTQICRVRMQSFEYGTDELIFNWTAALDNFARLDTEDFIVEAVQLEPYNKTYFGQAMWNGRKFSRLEFRIILRRRFSYHMLETYLPSVLFVMCAWLSFLVPRSAIPGRMALCVTTLLSMTAMVAAVKKLTPHSQYIKAIEVWLLACLCFIFYALFAFLLALKIASFEKTLKRARTIRSRQSVYCMPDEEEAKKEYCTTDVDHGTVIQQQQQRPPPKVVVKNPGNVWKNAADWFEFSSFVAYPITFVAFSIWYSYRLAKAAGVYKSFIPNHD